MSTTITKRVVSTGGSAAIPGSIGSDTWGGTFGLTWGKTWYFSVPEQPGTGSASPFPFNTQRVATEPAGDNTRRVSGRPRTTSQLLLETGTGALLLVSGDYLLLAQGTNPDHTKRVTDVVT